MSPKRLGVEHRRGGQQALAVTLTIWQATPHGYSFRKLIAPRHLFARRCMFRFALLPRLCPFRSQVDSIPACPFGSPKPKSFSTQRLWGNWVRLAQDSFVVTPQGVPFAPPAATVQTNPMGRIGFVLHNPSSLGRRGSRRRGAFPDAPNWTLTIHHAQSAVQRAYRLEDSEIILLLRTGKP
jgi:hypothetical protein